MTLRRAIMLSTIALFLASCGSSPKTHYFALSPVPEANHHSAPVATPVTVAAVHLPPALDRKEMVRATGANTVDVSDQDRWAAPLGEMSRRVLSEDLAARLPKDKVIVPDSPAPPHTGQIVVAIAQFGPDGKGKVTLEGSWSLLDRGNLVLRRDVALAIDSPAPGGDVEAAAMSRLLGQLASGIAGTLAETDARRAERGNQRK